jgi:translation initiation factor IF-1
MGSIKKVVEAMDPEKAMREIADVAKELFAHVSEKVRTDFIYTLTGDADDEGVPGLVHL